MRARGEPVADDRTLARLPRSELVDAGLCRRHDQLSRPKLSKRGRRTAVPDWGIHARAQYRHQSGWRARDLFRSARASSSGARHDRRRESEPQTRRDERRTFGVASGAHALHDGYTDLIYVMLPVWQAEFGLSYAAIGAHARHCSPAPWPACKFRPDIWPSDYGAAPCSPPAPRLPVLAIVWPALSGGFIDARHRACDRRPRRQHAASHCIGFGRARVQGPALAARRSAATISRAISAR